MRSIDMEILNELKDEDIKILCQNADLNQMMTPIKQNGKQYAKYTAQLGRLDKKSVLVKKNLPRLAFDLYKKGDVNYLKFFEMTALNMKKMFKTMLQECMGVNVEPQDIQDFSISDYKKLFSELLKSHGQIMDFDLFFLQTRMYGIIINDDMKAEIINEWKYLKELDSVRKEVIDIQKEETKKKEDELRDEIACQKYKLKNEIREIQSEVTHLNCEVDSKQKTIVLLMQENESVRYEAKQQQSVIKNKDDEIKRLRRKQEETQADFDDISAKIYAKTKDIYSEVQTIWQVENEEKLKEIKELEHKIAQYMDTLQELQLKSNQQEIRVEEWDEYIESYFSKIDQKIIEHKIESLLYQKGKCISEEVAVTSEDTIQSGTLYIQKGYKVIEFEECADYEDYIEIVETNLSSVGDKMPIGTINDCFNAAIDAGLHPLICGFGARQFALALTAARYAEKSEIISVPMGFNSTQELANAISYAQTDSIIIEDAFGTMNENLLLPILRDSNGKKVVFTAESTEDLKYLQKHFYNYIQLLVTDKRMIVKTHKFIYSYADRLFSEKVYSEKEQGHKLARQVFEYIGMSSSYVLTRGNVLCELLAESKDNSKDDALQKLIITELKWILVEEQHDKLNEILLLMGISSH